jgi:hypothetical protein
MPMWFVTFLKYGATAVSAIVVMWGAQQVLRRDVDENRARIAKLEIYNEAHVQALSASKSDIIVLQTRLAVLDKGIADTLNRLEADLKEVKRDVKEIQLRAKP